jgi:hypothetical protein
VSKTCDAYAPPTGKPEDSGFCDRCGMHDWRHAAPAVQPGTCDASTPSAVGDPLGPCVLRYGHDGPVHQTAGGAKWWPCAGAEASDGPREKLFVKKTGPAARPCGSGCHVDHPGDTCEEADEDLAGWNGWFETWARIAMPAAFGLIPEVPGALRGPDYPSRRHDSAPLRKLAKEARDEGLHFEYDTTAQQCRAEFHHPTMQSARCDLLASHGELHREQADPSRCAFRWDDNVAMYPTDPTTSED